MELVFVTLTETHEGPGWFLSGLTTVKLCRTIQRLTLRISNVMGEQRLQRFQEFTV